MARTRKGRGRLSSLDTIPDEGQDDVLWALGELNQRARTQQDILAELNERLEAKGIDPISRSAFNRRAVRLAAAARRLEESRYLFAGLADQFTPDRIDEGNVGLGEVIKTLIFELLDPDRGHTPETAMQLARAYQATISGQRISSDRRRKLEADYQEKVARTIDTVAKEGGLSAERIAQLRRDFLGVREKG